MSDYERVMMIDIKANELFYECEHGHCEPFIAFGDAHYEEPNVIVVYGMHKHTQQIERFMMDEGQLVYAPKLYRKIENAD